MAASNEDCTASDEVDEGEQNVIEDLNCTLCLKVFKSPRRLPCSHSFCEECLQSHILDSITVKDSEFEFSCPICKTVVHSEVEISLDKWVYLFPLNTLLISVLMKLKAKVNLLCDVCLAQDVQNPASDLCMLCEQALCENCSRTHRNLRLLNTHDILKIDELPSKQDIVLQHNTVFKCVDHAYLPFEFYCKNHEVQLCCKCFVSHHKSCSKVVELNTETSNVSYTLNDIKLQIKRLEDRVKLLTNINVSHLKKLESQIIDMSEEIRAMKKSINNALDDLDRRVTIECGKIYMEEMKKIEQFKSVCQSQIMSIRNSHFIVDSVSRFATESQMFLLVKSMSRHLSFAKRHLETNYIQNDSIKLELEFNPQFLSSASIPRVQIANIKMTKNDENAMVTTGFKSLTRFEAEDVNVEEITVQGDEIPCYADVNYVSRDLVMLLDYENKVCHLLDSLFNSLSFYILPGSPAQLCATGQGEIAVSMPHHQTIQFLSIIDNTIIPTRKVATRSECYGIAVVGQDEMRVSGPCSNGKYYWSIISMDGKEKSCQEFDGAGCSWTYAALNASKTFLYVSVYQDNSLRCFGLDGKKYFTFKHQDLKGPHAVTIDRDDNIYVVGNNSHNIFQLSSDGVFIQTTTNIVIKDPMAMCFNEDCGMCLLSCWKNKDLHIFRLALAWD